MIYDNAPLPRIDMPEFAHAIEFPHRVFSLPGQAVSVHHLNRLLIHFHQSTIFVLFIFASLAGDANNWKNTFVPSGEIS